MAELAREVAKECELSEKELDQIEMAGMIHDIGLLGLPEDALVKDENYMNETEFKIFSQHPVIASICLESVEKLKKISEITFHHHEHFDGSGFPDGLAGDQIPLGSRIIGAVGDYCKVMDMWPRETSQIIDRMRKCLGAAVSKDFEVTEPNDMIGKIADKVVLLGAHQKYDIEVVTKLMKRIGEARKALGSGQQVEKRILLNKLNELKEGMVMARDLRVKDGRLLLGKGMTLKETSIGSIRNLAERELIEDNIYVAI